MGNYIFLCSLSESNEFSRKYFQENINTYQIKHSFERNNLFLQLLARIIFPFIAVALCCCNKQFVEKKMRIPKTLFFLVSLASLSVFDMFTNKAKPVVKGGPRLGLHLSAALSNSSSNIALHPAALLALLRALHHCGCSFIERERIVRPPILPSTLWALAVSIAGKFSNKDEPGSDSGGYAQLFITFGCCFATLCPNSLCTK